MRKIVTGVCYILLFLAGMKAAVVYGAQVSWVNYSRADVVVSNENNHVAWFVPRNGSVDVWMYAAPHIVIDTNGGSVSIDFTDDEATLDANPWRFQVVNAGSGLAIEYSDPTIEPISYLPTFMLGWVTAVVMGLGSVGIRMLAAAGKTTTTEL